MTERQKKLDRLGARLDPDLRDFIDRAIVPALVREYIAEHGSAIRVAKPATAVPQFQPDARLSAERILE